MMTRYGVAYLIGEPVSRGVYETPEREQRKVLVRIQSISQSEKYSADQAGYAMEKKFILNHYRDFHDERFIRFDGKIYKISRIYNANDGIELTCERAEEGAL